MAIQVTTSGTVTATPVNAGDLQAVYDYIVERNPDNTEVTLNSDSVTITVNQQLTLE